VAVEETASIELGGNISLSGFSSEDFTELIVVKKIVGQYARKLTDISECTHLAVHRRPIHSSEVEIAVHADVNGSRLSADSTQHNLFVALDDALKKILEQARR
jgi:ribosome-associated translation inhibitor RaiA